MSGEPCVYIGIRAKNQRLCQDTRKKIDILIIIVHIYRITELNSVPNYIIASISLIIMVPNLTQKCTYTIAFYM